MKKALITLVVAAITVSLSGLYAQPPADGDGKRPGVEERGDRKGDGKGKKGDRKGKKGDGKGKKGDGKGKGGKGGKGGR